MLFNFLIFPYRDFYFQKKYGPVVRDLQIMEALSGLSSVHKLTVVNRPVSIYERVTSKSHAPTSDQSRNISFLDKTSYDIFGPLRGRKWTEFCYNEYDSINFYEDGKINVILDFTPISKIKFNAIKSDAVWYDLIDNFSKHNRYDAKERHLVDEKYELVRSEADLVTGVSNAAIGTFQGGVCLPNAAGISPDEVIGNSHRMGKKANFGFIGFITDKFDIGFVRHISKLGYSVNLYGEIYNKNVKNELSQIENVNIYGKFRHEDIPSILGTFEVGLIPYIKGKLHDESPIKLYQYLRYGLPVLTSVQFEISGPSVVCYDGMNHEDIAKQCRELLKLAADPSAKSDIASLIGPEHYWNSKLLPILAQLQAATKDR